ncbi:MAG: DoxX family protein [Ferruginibacter sp.]
MNYVQRFEHWGDTHHPKWIDIIRIALGVFLCYKGFDFLKNMSLLIAAMANKTPFNTFEVVMLGHYIAYAHMIGGLLLIVGIGTRIASLMQIPILMVQLFSSMQAVEYSGLIRTRFIHYYIGTINLFFNCGKRAIIN